MKTEIKNLNVRLQSENLDFVDVSENLITDYLKMINNPSVAKLLSAEPKPFTYDDEVEWVRNALEKKLALFSLIERRYQKFVGNVELMDVTESGAEIGIALDEDFWGKGFGSEALKRIVDYAFDKLRLDEVHLVVFSHNLRAIRCYQKLGFEVYKTEQNVAEIDGVSVDDVYMKLEKH